MSTIFEDLAMDVLREAGANYREARRILIDRRAYAGDLAFRYTMALKALEAIRQNELEDDDA
jgi:hypothetical protein